MNKIKGILLISIKCRIVKDTVGSIAESERQVESASRQMEQIIWH